MEVFVLLAVTDYEGSELLGVYHTQADAESARDAYIAKLAVDRIRYDGYDIQRRVIGADARADWEK
jgi:5-methylthioribose kinase